MSQFFFQCFKKSWNGVISLHATVSNRAKKNYYKFFVAYLLHYTKKYEEAQIQQRTYDGVIFLYLSSYISDVAHIQQ